MLCSDYQQSVHREDAAPTLALLRRNGVFNDTETLDAFCMSGLLEAGSIE